MGERNWRDDSKHLFEQLQTIISDSEAYVIVVI